MFINDKLFQRSILHFWYNINTICGSASMFKEMNYFHFELQQSTSNKIFHKYEKLRLLDMSKEFNMTFFGHV